MLSQGTRVAITLPYIGEVLGKVVGAAIPPHVGIVYIIEPDQNIMSEHYQYSHCVVPAELVFVIGAN